jgi:hypothetical protein
MSKTALNSNQFESKKRAQQVTARLDSIRLKTFSELTEEEKQFLLRQLFEGAQFVKPEV